MKIKRVCCTVIIILLVILGLVKSLDGNANNLLDVSKNEWGIEEQGENTKIEESSETEEYILKCYNVESMIGLNLYKGDIVETTCFYDLEYGGAAKYIIVDESVNEECGFSNIALKNGLFAQQIVENNIVYPEQLGAYGDGKHDDTDAIQKCMRSSYIVECKKNATYKLSKGIYLGNISKSIIHGNGATFDIDELKTYFFDEANKNECGGQGYFYGHFFFFSREQAINKIEWDNLEINWNVETRQEQVETYYLIKVWETKEIAFSKVNINIKGNPLGAVQPIAIMPGQYNKIEIEDSNISNFNHAYTGSCLWFYGECNDFSIRDCEFYSSCMDEIISVITKYSHDIQVINCDIVKNNMLCASKEYSEVNGNPNVIITHIAKSGESGNEIHNMTFKQCKFNSYSEVGVIPKDFLFVNTYDANENYTIFEECEIKGKFSKAFLAAETLENTEVSLTNIEDNLVYQEKLKVFFADCIMELDTPTIATTRGVNFEISNSHLELKENLIDLTYVDSFINCWTGKFDNNCIVIDNTKGVIIGFSHKYLIGLSVNNCEIQLNNINSEFDIIQEQEKDVSHFVQRHSNNARGYIEWENNTVK